MQNPLLVETGLPAFDKINAVQVQPAVEHVLGECSRLLDRLEESDPKTLSLQKLNDAVDLINRKIHRAWSPVTHLLGVMNNTELRQAHEAMQNKVVAFGLRYSQSQKIYDTLKYIKQNSYATLSAEEKRLVDLGIRNAELSGIGLSGQAKIRFNEISQELSAISTKFSNNVLDATKAFSLVIADPKDIAGLPENARALAAQAYNVHEKSSHATPANGPWRITLDPPSYMAFMQHGKNRSLREQLFRANISRASQPPFDNTELLPKILQMRAEKAKLLGFKNYAELSLARKMAGSVKAVFALADELLDRSIGAAKKEFSDLQAFAKKQGEAAELAHWDIAFWSERMREYLYEYSDEEIKPYFPLPQVLEGMFALVKRIFAVQVEAADGEAPVWHPDVRYFKIYDESRQHIASFYLDPYARAATKRGGAWMDDCLGREQINGTLQVPVAHLICNSTPPVGDEPSLMTFGEVTTLFHEFGHGLQHMLTRVEIPQLAGINSVEWDAVELPSQFMENWCYHEATIMQLAKHYKTGEPLPKTLFDKLYAAKNYMAASQMLRQLRFAMTDMKLHEQTSPLSSADIFALGQNVAEKTSLLKPLNEDRMLCSFSHIFAGGYAAGYYSYKWAEVLSADAFAAFEEAGLDKPSALSAVGKRFRETVLALGGSVHPMDVFRTFRGREPNSQALLRHNGLASS